MERRIAAILAADMVGYSRLIEQDEEGVLARQKKHRIDLIDPEIKKHNGKIIKLTGDGMITEFGSVVEAVQCAVLIQREMDAREADFPEDQRIVYRIAVHLGDVVFDEGDVYGDGVNIAARLEAIADPGGIVVSGTAHDLLKAHVDVGYRSLGEKRLKNIAQPVRVFQVTDTPETPTRPKAKKVWFAATTLVLAVGLAVSYWWATRQDFTPARVDEIAFAIPDKPSIAVTPFQNATGKPEMEWLSVALSANVISALSSSPDLVLISRNALDDMIGLPPGQIAERYGVQYVLDGTVQGDETRLRVSARLANALEGRTLWSGSWDKALDDVFEIQDEISDAILEELQVKLTLGEQARNWRQDFASVENMRDLLDGRVAFQTNRPEDHEVVARHWDAIYDRNPDLPAAMSLQGWKHFHKAAVGLSKDPAAEMRTAQDWAQKAIDAGYHGEPHIVLAAASHVLGERERALENATLGLEAEPGTADVVMVAGWIYAARGRLQEGIDLMQRAMRLEPDYPDWLASALSNAKLQNGDWAEARDMANAILASDAKDVRSKPRALMLLTAVSMWEGDKAEARQHMATLLGAIPAMNRTKAAHMSQSSLKSDQDFAQGYLDALVEAGLPETPKQGASLSLSDKPSIAVLPFANHSGNAEYDYLGDGLAGNIISSLGTIPQVFVIARHSSFALRDSPEDVVGIAEALGVRYVLDGSVQVSGGRLRTSVELIDAPNGRQIWTRQFNNDLAVEDLFAVQDQIVADMLVELGATLVSGDNSRLVFREAADLETFKQIMLGLAEVDKITIEADRKALEHFEAALVRDPGSAYSHFGKSWVTINSIMMGVAPDPAEALETARLHAEKALRANPKAAVSHIAMAYVHLVKREHDLAIASAEHAVSLVPSDGRIASQAGWVLSASGMPERGEALFRFGLRAQPSPPVWVPNGIGVTLLMRGDANAAKRFFEQANDIFPNQMTHAHLAVIAAQQGDADAARQHVQSARKIYPRTSVAGFARYLAYFRDQAYLEGFLNALRHAGYPETAP